MVGGQVHGIYVQKEYPNRAFKKRLTISEVIIFLVSSRNHDVS